MAKSAKLPDRATLRAHFSDAGNTIRWVLPTNRRVKVGQLAEQQDTSGYLRVALHGRTYRVHNVLWVLRNGDIPDGFLLDHEDGNRLNNSAGNHRLATIPQNCQNSRLRTDNTSGVKGVRFDPEKRKWRAEIRADGRYHNLGRFGCAAEAEAAVTAARVRLHGQFANHGVPTHV